MAASLNALSNLFTLLFVVTSMLSMGLALPSTRLRLRTLGPNPGESPLCRLRLSHAPPLHQLAVMSLTGSRLSPVLPSLG